jgi:Na+/proline symporter
VFNCEDWAVVAIFAATMLAITWYAMRTKAQSGKDYFLSGRVRIGAAQSRGGRSLLRETRPR